MRHQWYRYMEERQKVALAVCGFMAVCVPIIVGVVLLFVSSWLRGMQVLGLPAPHDIHRTMWGWLSDYSYRPELHNSAGQLVQTAANPAEPNGVALAWFMGWIAVWIFYQVGEGITFLVRTFARVARQEPRQEVVPARKGVGGK